MSNNTNTAGEALDLNKLELCAKKGAHVSREDFLALITLARRAAQPAIDLNKSRAEFEAWANEDMPNAGAIVKIAAERAWQAARRSLPVDAADDDKLIEEAVKSNNVYGVLPNSASTMSIGRAVLAAHRAALARAGSAAPTGQQADEYDDCPKCKGSRVLGEVRGIRCCNCDGTGMVHRADGEYLGECNCEASTGQQAEPVAKRLYRTDDFGVQWEVTPEQAAQIDAAMSAAQAQPKDTTDTRRDA